MKMKFLSTMLASALVAALPASAQAAAFVDNLDGSYNINLDSRDANVVSTNGTTLLSGATTSALSVLLGPGKYVLKFVESDFTAFSRYSSNTGCDTNGQNCSRGFENSIDYIINGTSFRFGNGNTGGTLGPVNPGDGYFASASQSLQNVQFRTAIFELAQATNVKFFIKDSNVSDNRGGVSVLLTAVPEPATWAMFILGFGLIGFSMRRRNGTTANLSFA